jgi:hypothetical protein
VYLERCGLGLVQAETLAHRAVTGRPAEHWLGGLRLMLPRMWVAMKEWADWIIIGVALLVILGAVIGLIVLPG